MKYKYIITTLLCLTLISVQLIGCGSLSSKADYDSYQSEEILINASDIIIYGEIVKEEKAKKMNLNSNKSEEQTEEDMIMYTVFDVRVDTVLKGTVNPGDVIKVKQLGDKNGISEKSIEDNGGYYEKGSTYIMFLASFEDILPGTPYEVLNPVQGQLEFIDGILQSNKNNPLFTKNTNKEDILINIEEIVKKE